MKTRKLLSVIISAILLLSMFPLSASAYSKEKVTLTFSDSEVTSSAESSGYTISGTTLTITSKGTYRITGSCSEGSVTVAKGLSDVTLILDNLTLTSAKTAPIVVKNSSSVLIKTQGVSTLTNNEDASTEATNEDYEGAAIKIKTGSSLTMFGDGTLKAVGNSKNGIKGAATSSLTFNGGTYIVTAANNGIAADGTVTINDGTFNVTSSNDAIKSEPDAGDTDSAGKVEINGGTFTINAQGDGIQAAENLTITNGTFDIKTLDGYNSSSFNKNTMSCKGLKASGNNDNETEPTNQLNISGGTFNLNTADDAVHSDGYATITGGTFKIYSGDDGVHADATLTLGVENGYERDPEIYIYSSYEGLEGAVVNVYQGKYYVIASDDGINAAGGSSNGSDPSQGGQDPFRPGRPGQGGMPGQNTSSGNYSLNIYGGDFYVNCEGDGLDSNGTISLLGGNLTILSMRGGGDNSPIDADGNITIKGATVFAAGSQGMGMRLSNSQNYYSSNSSYQANTVVNVSTNGTLVRSEKLVRNISYLFYSSPNMTSNSASVSTASSVTTCKSNGFEHKFDNGVTEKAATTSSAGVMKYTCSSCNEVERKTIPKTTEVTEYTEEDDEEETTQAEEDDKGYNVSFLADSHSSVNVYHTQDYTSVSETGVTTAVSRNSDTGSPDSTGTGQVNFAVVTDSGYKVDSITVEGGYNALKTVSANDNIYRVTKVTSDIVITVTTKAEDGTEQEDEGYKVSFVTDGNASINVYYSQDYTSADETNATSSCSRNSATGALDSTGEGQVNFAVVLAEGCEIDSITIDGTYKNLKGPEDTGAENTYRITKIQSALTVTVKTKAIAGEAEETTDAAEAATSAVEATTAPESGEQATTAQTSATEAVETTEAQTTTAQETETVEQSATAAATTAPTTEPQSTTKGVGAGADFTSADKLIKNSKTEEPKGAAFSKLVARAVKITKKSVTLKWKKASGAEKYVVYANACGTKNKFKKLTTLSSSKTKIKITKLNGKKLKKGTYYKFLVVAVNSENKVVSTACTIHTATKGGKVGNYKTVKTAAKNNKVTLSLGKTFKLKAKAVPQSKKKKVKAHRAVKYESSNKNIAAVSSKGVITAKKKGTCYVYVYAQSGTYKRIKVIVK